MTPNNTGDMHDGLSDRRLSNLYREAVKEEPPMKLDSAVLSEAKKAVEKKSWWRRMGWVAPLATAAVAMLTVSLVIQMKQQHPETMAPASVEEAAPALPALKSAPANKVLLKEERRQREAQDTVKRKSVAPASAPAKLAAPSAAGMAEPEQEFMRRSTMMEEEKATEADAVAPLADMPAEVQTAPKSEKMLDPENWIVKIRELLKQGEKDEARKEIEAFKAAYPDFELPDDLN